MKFIDEVPLMIIKDVPKLTRECLRSFINPVSFITLKILLNSENARSTVMLQWKGNREGRRLNVGLK